jgi:hypothetical protein
VRENGGKSAEKKKGQIWCEKNEVKLFSKTIGYLYISHIGAKLKPIKDAKL